MSLIAKLLGGGSPPEQRFWDWFAQNSNRLAAVETCREPVCDELLKQLIKVKRGLVFTFGPVKDGRREFIVSADGNRELFPDVQRLVAAAPSLPAWDVIAFRPAIEDPAGFSVQFGDKKLDIDDVWFDARPNGGRVDIVLYIRNGPDDVVAGAAFFLLDHLLGEYDVETKIGVVEYAALPAEPVSAGLRPLSKLPDVVRSLIVGNFGINFVES
ncbi:MAG: hypothetical protein HYX78_11870 [Armatimonadetes bacterium]|nr:hypothetical protein [Armatimonadota bacterium]